MLPQKATWHDVLREYQCFPLSASQFGAVLGYTGGGASNPNAQFHHEAAEFNSVYIASKRQQLQTQASQRHTYSPDMQLPSQLPKLHHGNRDPSSRTHRTIFSGEIDAQRNQPHQNRHHIITLPLSFAPVPPPVPLALQKKKQALSSYVPGSCWDDLNANHLYSDYYAYTSQQQGGGAGSGSVRQYIDYLRYHHRHSLHGWPVYCWSLRLASFRRKAAPLLKQFIVAWIRLLRLRMSLLYSISSTLDGTQNVSGVTTRNHGEEEKKTELTDPSTHCDDFSVKESVIHSDTSEDEGVAKDDKKCFRHPLKVWSLLRSCGADHGEILKMFCGIDTSAEQIKRLGLQTEALRRDLCGLIALYTGEWKSRKRRRSETPFYVMDERTSIGDKEGLWDLRLQLHGIYRALFLTATGTDSVCNSEHSHSNHPCRCSLSKNGIANSSTQRPTLFSVMKELAADLLGSMMVDGLGVQWNYYDFCYGDAHNASLAPEYSPDHEPIHTHQPVSNLCLASASPTDIVTTVQQMLRDDLQHLASNALVCNAEVGERAINAEARKKSYTYRKRERSGNYDTSAHFDCKNQMRNLPNIFLRVGRRQQYLQKHFESLYVTGFREPCDTAVRDRVVINVDDDSLDDTPADVAARDAGGDRNEEDDDTENDDDDDEHPHPEDAQAQAAVPASPLSFSGNAATQHGVRGEGFAKLIYECAMLREDTQSWRAEEKKARGDAADHGQHLDGTVPLPRQMSSGTVADGGFYVDHAAGIYDCVASSERCHTPCQEGERDCTDGIIHPSEMIGGGKWRTTPTGVSSSGGDYLRYLLGASPDGVVLFHTPPLPAHCPARSPATREQDSTPFDVHDRQHKKDSPDTAFCPNEVPTQSVVRTVLLHGGSNATEQGERHEGMYHGPLRRVHGTVKVRRHKNYAQTVPSRPSPSSLPQQQEQKQQSPPHLLRRPHPYRLLEIKCPQRALYAEYSSFCDSKPGDENASERDPLAASSIHQPSFRYHLLGALQHARHECFYYYYNNEYQYQGKDGTVLKSTMSMNSMTKGIPFHYFCQLQGQMGISGAKECDFFVLLRYPPPAVMTLSGSALASKTTTLQTQLRVADTMYEEGHPAACAWRAHYCYAFWITFLRPKLLLVLRYVMMDEGCYQACVRRAESYCPPPPSQQAHLSPRYSHYSHPFSEGNEDHQLLVKTLHRLAHAGVFHSSVGRTCHRISQDEVQREASRHSKINISNYYFINNDGPLLFSSLWAVCCGRFPAGPVGGLSNESCSSDAASASLSSSSTLLQRTKTPFSLLKSSSSSSVLSSSSSSSSSLGYTNLPSLPHNILSSHQAAVRTNDAIDAVNVANPSSPVSASVTVAITPPLPLGSIVSDSYNTKELSVPHSAAHQRLKITDQRQQAAAIRSTFTFSPSLATAPVVPSRSCAPGQDDQSLNPTECNQSGSAVTSCAVVKTHTYYVHYAGYNCDNIYVGSLHDHDTDYDSAHNDAASALSSQSTADGTHQQSTISPSFWCANASLPHTTQLTQSRQEEYYSSTALTGFANPFCDHNRGGSGCEVTENDKLRVPYRYNHSVGRRTNYNTHIQSDIILHGGFCFPPYYGFFIDDGDHITNTTTEERIGTETRRQSQAEGATAIPSPPFHSHNDHHPPDGRVRHPSIKYCYPQRNHEDNTELKAATLPMVHPLVAPVNLAWLWSCSIAQQQHSRLKSHFNLGLHGSINSTSSDLCKRNRQFMPFLCDALQAAAAPTGDDSRKGGIHSNLLLRIGELGTLWHVSCVDSQDQECYSTARNPDIVSDKADGKACVLAMRTSFDHRRHSFFVPSTLSFPPDSPDTFSVPPLEWSRTPYVASCRDSALLSLLVGGYAYGGSCGPCADAKVHDKNGGNTESEPQVGASNCPGQHDHVTIRKPPAAAANSVYIGDYVVIPLDVVIKVDALEGGGGHGLLSCLCKVLDMGVAETDQLLPQTQFKSEVTDCHPKENHYVDPIAVTRLHGSGLSCEYISLRCFPLRLCAGNANFSTAADPMRSRKQIKGEESSPVDFSAISPPHLLHAPTTFDVTIPLVEAGTYFGDRLTGLIYNRADGQSFSNAVTFALPYASIAPLCGALLDDRRGVFGASAPVLAELVSATVDVRCIRGLLHRRVNTDHHHDSSCGGHHSHQRTLRCDATLHKLLGGDREHPPPFCFGVTVACLKACDGYAAFTNVPFQVKNVPVLNPETDVISKESMERQKQSQLDIRNVLKTSCRQSNVFATAQSPAPTVIRHTQERHFIIESSDDDDHQNVSNSADCDTKAVNQKKMTMPAAVLQDEDASSSDVVILSPRSEPELQRSERHDTAEADHVAVESSARMHCSSHCNGIFHAVNDGDTSVDDNVDHLRFVYAGRGIQIQYKEEHAEEVHEEDDVEMRGDAVQYRITGSIKIGDVVWRMDDVLNSTLFQIDDDVAADGGRDGRVRKRQRQHHHHQNEQAFTHHDKEASDGGGYEDVDEDDTIDPEVHKNNDVRCETGRGFLHNPNILYSRSTSGSAAGCACTISVLDNYLFNLFTSTPLIFEGFDVRQDLIESSETHVGNGSVNFSRDDANIAYGQQHTVYMRLRSLAHFPHPQTRAGECAISPSRPQCLVALYTHRGRMHSSTSTSSRPCRRRPICISLDNYVSIYREVWMVGPSRASFPSPHDCRDIKGASVLRSAQLSLWYRLVQWLLCHRSSSSSPSTSSPSTHGGDHHFNHHDHFGHYFFGRPIYERREGFPLGVVCLRQRHARCWANHSSKNAPPKCSRLVVEWLWHPAPLDDSDAVVDTHIGGDGGETVKSGSSANNRQMGESSTGFGDCQHPCTIILALVESEAVYTEAVKVRRFYHESMPMRQGNERDTVITAEHAAFSAAAWLVCDNRDSSCVSTRESGWVPAVCRLRPAAAISSDAAVVDFTRGTAEGGSNPSDSFGVAPTATVWIGSSLKHLIKEVLAALPLRQHKT